MYHNNTSISLDNFLTFFAKNQATELKMAEAGTKISHVTQRHHFISRISNKTDSDSRYLLELIRIDIAVTLSKLQRLKDLIKRSTRNRVLNFCTNFPRTSCTVAARLPRFPLTQCNYDSYYQTIKLISLSPHKKASLRRATLSSAEHDRLCFQTVL